MSPLIAVREYIAQGRWMKLRPLDTASSRREDVSIG